jgi:nucleoside-diphosphate-sugar epimerase
LAIIFAEVWRQLLLRDAVGFAVSTDVDDGDGDGESVGGFPVVVRIIPMGTFSSSMALAHLNTCGSRALVLLLRQLKRAYWPWAWDTGLDDPRDGASGGGGGFLAAARAFLEETQEDGVAGSGSSGTRRGVDAATAAISAAAAHRLARGVWTSSGAGDLRRARAAAERLVVLCGSSSLYCPREKRDLAVLLVHCGELAAALDLLREYERDVKRGEASQADGRGTWQPSAAEGAAVEALVGVLPAVIAATEAAAAAVAADREGEGLGEGLEGGGIASGTRRKIPWALSPPSGAEGGGGERTWYRSPSVVVASPVAPQRRASLASARRPRAASALPSVSAVSSSSSSSIDIIDDIARAPVVVLGASGRTGAEVVRYCVSAGRPVRACTRSGAFDAATVLGDDALAAATVPWSSPLVTSARADVTQPDTLAAAVAGASMVIFAATAPANGANPDDVDHLGLVNAAAACIAADVPRLVVVSGAGVTKPQSPAYGFLNMFGRRMDAKVAGEDAVRALYRSSSSSSHSSHSSGSGGGGGGGARKASGASPSYTVVRPSGLLDGPPKGPGALAVNQGDEAAGFINRADVAACCVQAGDVAGAAGATFEVYDAGTAVATASLSVADILSDPKLAAAVALVTGQTFRRMMGGGGGGGDGVVTARERRGGDYASLLDGLHPDDEL